MNITYLIIAITVAPQDQRRLSDKLTLLLDCFRPGVGYPWSFPHLFASNQRLFTRLKSGNPGSCVRNIAIASRFWSGHACPKFGKWGSCVITFPWKQNCAWNLLSQKLLRLKVFIRYLPAAAVPRVFSGVGRVLSQDEKLADRNPLAREGGPLANTQKKNLRNDC